MPLNLVEGVFWRPGRLGLARRPSLQYGDPRRAEIIQPDSRFVAHHRKILYLTMCIGRRGIVLDLAE